jgi:hypothetical protein
MIVRFALLAIGLFLGTLQVAAQSPHSTPEQRAKAKAKADYGVFRRNIVSLKEFNEERKKIPALQKENKMSVKVIATIDSVEADDDKATTLTGYITQVIGDNTTNAYEITFDRTTRKITKVKRTEEAVDVQAAAKPAAKKPAGATTKPATKKKEGEEEEGEEEEKTPAGTKEKEEE